MFGKNPEMFEKAADRGAAAARAAFMEIQPGLTLQLVDLRAEAGQSQRVLIPPSLGISVLLQGRAELRCGRHRFLFDAGTRLLARVPQVSLFQVAEEIEMMRHVEADVRVRHLSVQATPDWVDRSGVGSCIAGTTSVDNAMQLPVWRASGRIVALCEQLLVENDPDTALGRLRRESQVLDVLGQVLMARVPNPPRMALDARRLRRLRQVREQLESESEAPTVEQLACGAGMSVDTLQREFRAAFGTTVFGYLQEYRLQRAYRALEAGSPVSRAAYAAGYSSPANFSTAFKRRFGVSPKEVRRAR